MAKEKSIVEILLLYTHILFVSNNAYIGTMGGVHRSTAMLHLPSTAAINLSLFPTRRTFSYKGSPQ